jgi:hypothetical protein
MYAPMLHARVQLLQLGVIGIVLVIAHCALVQSVPGQYVPYRYGSQANNSSHLLA